MTDTNLEDLPSADLAMIQRMIPHRYPFLFIDKVRDIRVGESAVGIKNVTINEPHFQGHFPAKPVMPGVMIVEAMAQTAGVLISQTLDLIDREPLVYFMTMDKFRFRKMVVPGDQLELHVRVIRGHGKIWKLWGEGKVDGAVASSGEFSAMIDVPKENK
ncbi:MAG: 3-hydroxyacyl-ACP dehydratase FabZ [Alphaproteobacteria bacterium]|nr:3-hydroxyacyl-ACP dehydratase FabZ [Alphaproteobacteria bacterium]